MINKKIQLGVIFYGAEEQLPANIRQFNDLKKSLTDFNVKRYNFNLKSRYQILLDYKRNKLNIILKNSYGRNHEADIELFLEKHRIPFLGSGAKSTLLGTNKFISKKLFKQNGIPVPQAVYIDIKKWQKQRSKLISNISRLKRPWVIKDVAGTDSRGIYQVTSLDECNMIIQNILKTAKHGLLVEEFIKKDKEIICLVIDNKKPTAFEPMEVIGDLFSHDVKDGVAKIRTQEVRGLPQKLTNKIKKISIHAHKLLGCKTFSRADILIKNNKPYLLEMDVHPGFSKKSVSTSSIRSKGLSLNELFLSFYTNKFLNNSL